jgi:hypothetical protein
VAVNSINHHQEEGPPWLNLRLSSSRGNAFYVPVKQEHINDSDSLGGTAAVQTNGPGN